METLTRDMTIEFNLNTTIFTPRQFTQGDKNTHIISLIPDRSLDIRDTRVVVTYVLPYGNTPIIEQYEPSSRLDIIVPNEALMKVGRVYVEVVFVNNITRDVITVLQHPYFDVVRTVHGSEDDAIAGATIQKTILSQLEEIDKLYDEKSEELMAVLEESIGEKVDVIVRAKLTENITAILNNINDISNTNIDKINTAGRQNIQNITSTGENQINSINNTTQTSKEQIISAGTSQVNNINGAGSTNVTHIQSEASKQIEQISSSGAQNVKLVTDEGKKQLSSITTTAEDKVQGINTAGTTQIDSINLKATEQTSKITSEGDKQAQRVTSEGNTQVARVTTEGDKQVDRVIQSGGGVAS